MSEERVTLITMEWLRARGFQILAFDFPQSGTGYALRPNGSMAKNEGIIIPDIVARRSDLSMVFENKDHFSLSDFKKLAAMRDTDQYEESLRKLFGGRMPAKILYGAAMPNEERHINGALKNSAMVDFIVAVDAADGPKMIFETSAH